MRLSALFLRYRIMSLPFENSSPVPGINEQKHGESGYKLAYSNSQFLMDFHETKLAIEFYDLDNLYLHLYIMEKDPETIETSHFDGIFPNRQ